eukprot:TRINITY_DN3773_c0_g2_i5.p1 TRINITY_DN3773_c0_g2~~TRINITY_DN3773_c0_g2_i5.p1  ORF type:complete len:871 (-),score=248.35 TRINITY_DN3773_c0_g2_i5:1133-3586(-)
MIVGKLQERSIATVDNPSPTVSLLFSFPLIISIHESNHLQIVDTLTGSVESHLVADICSCQCILFDGDRILCVSPKELFVFWKGYPDLATRVFRLQDDRCKKPLTSISQQFSAVINHKSFLFGNNEAFQIWNLNDVLPDGNSGTCTFMTEGKSRDSTQKFLSLHLYEDQIITTTRTYISLWTIGPGQNEEPEVTHIPTENIVTAIHLDDTFLITGDAIGNLCLMHRNTGELIYNLNYAGFTDYNEAEDLLQVSLDGRITSIAKVGRWIICGHQNGFLRVFDINLNNQPHPMAEFQIEDGSLLSLLVDSKDVLAVVARNVSTRPDILFWKPNLSGFVSNANPESENAIFSIYEKHSKIITHLQSLAAEFQEDASEFQFSMGQLMKLLRRIVDRGDIQVPAQLYVALEMSLDALLLEMDNLRDKNKLERAISNMRLRRNLELKNAMVLKRVARIDSSLDAESFRFERETLERMNLVAMLDQRPQKVSKRIMDLAAILPDPEAQDFWARMLGEPLVEWGTLLVVLERGLPGFQVNLHGNQLKMILDPCNIGYVTITRFSEFIRGFGPFNNAAENMNSVVTRPWFHGYLSYREAELLLQQEMKGSFLIRFSRTKPDGFALAFQMQQVSHILIDSTIIQYPQLIMGFKIKEQDTTANNNPRLYRSLHDLIQFYQFCLKLPYSTNMTGEGWFSGDMSSDETVEFLLNQKPATFCIRFSSSGALAASFVDVDLRIMHVIIKNEDKIFRITGGEENGFSTMSDLVEYYKSCGVFKLSLKDHFEDMRIEEEILERNETATREEQIQLETKLKSDELVTRTLHAQSD